jgi:predicted transcriptional regulator
LHVKPFPIQEIFCYGQLNKEESFLLSNIEAELSIELYVTLKKPCITNEEVLTFLKANKKSCVNWYQARSEGIWST